MKVLYVLFLLDSLNIAVYLPVYSAFVRSIGGTPFTLGLINSSSALISLFWNPIVGSLSDQNGRKGLLSKCMLASAFGSIILCLSSSSLYLVFVGKLVSAFGSPVSVLLRSTVADIFKKDEEKKLFLNKSAPIISLAFLVGSLSSGFLSEAKNGYSMAFLFMAIIMGLAAVLAYFSLTEDSKSNKSGKKVSFANKAIQELNVAVANLKTISWPRYQNLFIMKGLYDFSFCVVFTNIGLILLDEFGVEGRYMGYVFCMTSAAAISSNILKLKFHDIFVSIPDHKKIFQGSVVLFISYLGMGISTSVYLFLLFMAIMCFSRGFMDAFWMEMITTGTTENDRGKVFAAFENLFPLMLFISPALSGLLAEAFGERILLGSSTIPISLTCIMAYRHKKKD